MNLKKIITTLIMFSLIMMYGVSYAENELTINPDSVMIGGEIYEMTGVRYSLIDGDLTNDKSLTEPNMNFSSLIKKFSDGEIIKTLVVPQNTRVTIDYTNNIFKGHQVMKTDEEIENDILNDYEEPKSSFETDEFIDVEDATEFIDVEDATEFIDVEDTTLDGRTKYDITIDPTRTEIETELDTIAYLKFYGNYTDNSGRTIANRNCILTLKILTKGEKNKFLGKKSDYSQSDRIKYIRYEAGMNVAEFKNAYKSTIDNLIKPSEIAYLNNEGEFKIAQYKHKINDNTLKIGDRNNSNVQLIDTGKIYTGIYVTFQYIYDSTTKPSDLELDLERYMNTEGVAVGEEIDLVVPGDITGTGEIDVTDLSTMQEELVESIKLEGAYKEAADMDESGDIDVVDLSQIQEYIVEN